MPLLGAYDASQLLEHGCGALFRLSALPVSVAIVCDV